MSKLITASIDLTKLGDLVRQNHDAVTTATNGKKYVKIAIWINDNPDQYGNHVSIQMNPKEDSTSEKTYIGNGKFQSPKPPQPLKLEDDGLPF